MQLTRQRLARMRDAHPRTHAERARAAMHLARTPTYRPTCTEDGPGVAGSRRTRDGRSNPSTLTRHRHTSAQAGGVRGEKIPEKFESANVLDKKRAKIRQKGSRAFEIQFRDPCLLRSKRVPSKCVAQRASEKAAVHDERRARARLVARGRGQPRGDLDSRIQSVARSKHRLWNGAVPLRRLYDRFDEVHCI